MERGRFTWFSRIPFAGRGFREVLGEEAKRRARLLGFTGPAGVAASVGVGLLMATIPGVDDIRAGAAAVAVFFATVGTLSGLIGRSGLHSVAGLYAGVAAGVIYWAFTRLAVAVAEMTPPGIGALGAMCLGLAGVLGAFATFGALFFWADRRPGRMKRGAKAGLLWLVYLFLAGMVAGGFVISVSIISFAILGWLMPLASAALTLVAFVVAAVYSVQWATMFFFLEARGIYDPLVESLRMVREKRGRADGSPPEEIEAGSDEAETQKGDTDEDDH